MNMELDFHIEQLEGETLERAIDRAITVASAPGTNEAPVQPVRLTESAHGIAVTIEAEDTIESVVAKLNAEFQRRIEAGEIELPKPEVPAGVPTEDNGVTWRELHPSLRAVVLAALRREMYSAELQAAKTGAQNLAIAANISASTPRHLGDAYMLEGMSAGMQMSFGSLNQADFAMRRAFELALQELEGPTGK